MQPPQRPWEEPDPSTETMTQTQIEDLESPQSVLRDNLQKLLTKEWGTVRTITYGTLKKPEDRKTSHVHGSAECCEDIYTARSDL